MTNTSNWLQICGAHDQALENELSSNVQNKIKENEFSEDNVYYIKKLDLSLAKEGLEISDDRLDMLRQLCQLWYVDLIPRKITSHRKFIGPIIVAFKKALFPLIRYFLKDFISQQRKFNSRAISLFADLANHKKS